MQYIILIYSWHTSKWYTRTLYVLFAVRSLILRKGSIYSYDSVKEDEGTENSFMTNTSVFYQ